MGILTADLSIPLRDFTLDLAIEAAAGTPVAIVGPSGSGKSTVLRAIAGLVRPASGTVQLGSHIVFDAARRIDVSPDKRNVGLVFQDYALFPHLTVRQNVAYSRRLRAAAIDEVLASLAITHLADERPLRLSGGERQRVALARALACNPAALLLDEPTAALDVATRSHVIGTLAATLRRVSAPSLVVTHSFEEAAMLAGQLVVIEHGAIVQSGTPHAVRAAPATPFVARLTGMNVLPGRVVCSNDSTLATVELRDGQHVRSTMLLDGHGDVAALIAPAHITLDTQPPHGSTLNVISGSISSLVTLDNIVRVQVGELAVELTTHSSARLQLHVGMHVFASFKATNTRIIATDA